MVNVPAREGRTSQPFAYPSTSRWGPTMPLDDDDSHPELWLWPNTSQKGFPSVRTCRVTCVDPEFVTRTWAPDVSRGAPRGAAVVAAPDRSDESTMRSTSRPPSSPVADVTVWLPADSRSGPPH